MGHSAETCPNSRHLKHLMTSFYSRAVALTHPTITLPGFSTFAVAMALGATTSAALVPLGPMRGEPLLQFGLESPLLGQR